MFVVSSNGLLPIQSIFLRYQLQRISILLLDDKNCLSQYSLLTDFLSPGMCTFLNICIQFMSTVV